MIPAKELRNIARARLKDADALLASRRYDGAIYLCGYAVELALKARICSALKWQGYPSTTGEFKDQEDLVRPLAEKLQKAGFSIWYDEFQLKVGDSLRRSIDRGLANSRFGIVVLSLNFFAKNWPQYELDGLVAKEMSGGKAILPLWHKVSKDEVMRYSPSLADKVALNTAMHTIDELVEKLGEVLR